MGGYEYAPALPGTAGTKSVLIRVDAHVIDKTVKLWTGRVVYAAA